MRQQPINMFLTVLAIYDKGVLLNAILMLGVPALSKSTVNNNLLNNLTTAIPVHKDLNFNPNLTKTILDDLRMNELKRKTRSLTITNDNDFYDNQLFIDIVNSTDDDQYLIESQYFDSDLLSLNRSEILIYLNQSVAMAQQIDDEEQPNWSNATFDNLNNTNPSTKNQAFNNINYPTFVFFMHRIANFFAGQITIIYPLANISQTGSIWITCLITGIIFF